MSYQNYQIPVIQGRLNQMEQQYPQFQQGYYQPMYNSPYTHQQANIHQGLKGRPVTSIDEAKASMIDLDGSVFIFPDYGNNRIYTKQINLDGTATIKSYLLEVPESSAMTKNSEIVSKNHPNIDEVVKIMQSEIEQLKRQISELQHLKGGKNNVQSNANVKHDEYEV